MEQDARESKGKEASASKVQVQSRTREGSGKGIDQHDVRIKTFTLSSEQVYMSSDDTGTQSDQNPRKLLPALLLISPLPPHAPPPPK